MREDKTGQYIVRYKYLEPGPAGPLKGKVTTSDVWRKGDRFAWIFGQAEVTSVGRKRNGK